MIEYYTLYLPRSKREVKIEVSVPRYRANIEFDTLYLLDGQNAFKDQHAAFGRSIRATRALGFAAREMGKRIIGVAIYNSGSDLGRINEYTPFMIDNPASPEWKKQDVNQCYLYCQDFIETIIPFIENKYPVRRNADSRFIYGSSLAAVTAIYIALKYPNTFNYIGAYSTASFLFDQKFSSFLEESDLSDKKIFLYVGKSEFSDEIYDKSLYFNASMKIFSFLKSKGIKTRLNIDAYGGHNEETWGRHILDFINFIYFDDIYYTNPV